MNEYDNSRVLDVWMTVSEIMDIMEELGICVDSFTDDIYIPTLEELCRMFGVNSLEELRNMPHGPMAF